MDPVGQWTAAAYAASYNRLAGATGGFQPGAGGGGEYPAHGSPATPSTTSQLLLQAAHATPTLAGLPTAGSSSAFNPSGFLSPPPVGYDPVFTPFLHHANQKTHYTPLNVAQHRQAIVSTKAVSMETDTLRDNYNSIHHQTLAPSPAFYDQAPASVQPSTIAWTHQNNSQLPSPFGILPHESVVGTSPGGTKLAPTYENFNAAHFAAAQTLNHINSQLVAASYSDTTKRLACRPIESPPPKSSLPPSVTSSSSYFQESSPTSYSSRPDNTPSQFPVTKTQVLIANAGSKVYSSSGHQPNVNVTSTPTTNSSVVFPSRMQDKQSSRSTGGFQSPPAKNTASNNPALQATGTSKLQSVLERRDSSHESSQSSPISFVMMDSSQHRSTGTKLPSSSRPVVVSNPQQSQIQQVMNHQKSGSYRGFPSSTGSTPESEYSQGTGNRNCSSTDGGYSSGSSVGHNSVDCNALQRSPLNHSQPSPLGHVTSPAAYPMYNSPMTSMSSPSPVQQHPDQNGSYKQNPSPQIAPLSPLDASQSRPSSVGYPSVITRNDQNFSDRNAEFPQKQCWESTDHQIRNQGAKNPGFPSGEAPQTPNVVVIQQQRAPLGLTERQQPYFDSVPNQNNSDRGDPMIIVKNLQTMQQQCQAPPNPLPIADLKPLIEDSKLATRSLLSAKRKKSVETKVQENNSPTEFASRVPPPAHGNANQTQQNGGYVEYDRWNLPSSQKALSGNHEPYGTQNALHPGGSATSSTSNPTLMPHQLAASHPQPYFQPIHHLPASQHQSQELPSTDAPAGPSSAISEHLIIQKVKDVPIAKVIVPDVEEELGFLAETPKTNLLLKDNKNGNVKPPAPLKPVIPFSNPNSGFIGSFIKFLQGERESSPPPIRNNVKPAYIPPAVKTGKQTTNDSKAETNSKKPSSPPSSMDLEDDPRYFPQAKDTASRRLDTSGSDTDYDSLIPQTTCTSRVSPCKSSEEKDSRRQKPASKKKSARSRYSRETPRSRKRTRNSTGDDDDDDDIEEEEQEQEEKLPKRNTAKRKAKEKIKCLQDANDDLTDFNSSDSDPVWTPAESKHSKGSDDDSYGRRRSSRGKRKPPPKKKSKKSRFLESSDDENNVSQTSENNISDASENKGSSDIICGECSGPFKNKKDCIQCCNCKKFYHSKCSSLQTLQRLQKLGVKRKVWKCDDCKPLIEALKKQSEKTKKGRQKQKTKSKPAEENLEASLGTEEYFPFKSGEFIVIKTELKEKYPSIWRVDGKTLLQKYEPFDQNGEKLYRNISTYSGWTPQNRNIYQKIPIQFIVQSRNETIVKFLRSEMVDPAKEQAFLDQSLAETVKYQDNFEVYIQTLISQALDSNFLAEIFSEKDEYFLQNVEVIDKVTEERKLRLVSAVDWPLDSSIQHSLTVWPCYNVLAELNSSPNRFCDACVRSKVHARMILYGQPYNARTLDGMTPNPELSNKKDFMLCLECIKWVQLYNKLVHQKYIMYIECAKRVAEKRSSERNKDTTVILNELLADEEWLNKLFRQVRVTWADVEKAEREKQEKMGIKVEPVVKKPTPIQTISDGNPPTGTPKDSEGVLQEQEEMLVREIKVENESESPEEELADLEDCSITDSAEIMGMRENNETQDDGRLREGTEGTEPEPSEMEGAPEERFAQTEDGEKIPKES